MLAKKIGAGQAALALFLLQTPTIQPDAPKTCTSCAAWNADLQPFQVYGNTYYVGTAGLSSILVISPDGHVLLDAALPQSAALIDAHIRSLGLRTQDIKLILTSHAHYDHVGGVNALQRLTGATVAASASTAEALRLGRPTADDPQVTIPNNGFPAVSKVQTVRDGETLRVGQLEFTAHLTPGHTPGSTTWTWESCQPGRCLSMVYADSLNAVSADGFRFSGDDKTPSRVSAFEKSIATVEALKCDVLLSVHPSMSGLEDKLAARAKSPTPNPFIDAGACRAYAQTARKTLAERLAKER